MRNPGRRGGGSSRSAKGGSRPGTQLPHAQTGFDAFAGFPPHSFRPISRCKLRSGRPRFHQRHAKNFPRALLHSRSPLPGAEWWPPGFDGHRAAWKGARRNHRLHHARGEATRLQRRSAGSPAHCTATNLLSRATPAGSSTARNEHGFQQLARGMVQSRRKSGSDCVAAKPAGGEPKAGGFRNRDIA